jgi:hypothetical protein
MEIEEKRQDCLNMRKNTETMLEYMERNKEEQEKNPELKQVKYIIPWKLVAPDELKVDDHDVTRVRVDHEAKLNRYRKRKPWEAWIEEDEMDLEGDRILAEIQNYKSEVLFNHEDGGDF